MKIRNILKAFGFLEQDLVSEGKRLEAMEILTLAQGELVNSRRQRRAIEKQITTRVGGAR